MHSTFSFYSLAVMILYITYITLVTMYTVSFHTSLTLHTVFVCTAVLKVETKIQTHNKKLFMLHVYDSIQLDDESHFVIECTLLHDLRKL